MEVVASRSPPYGAIILTFLYIIFGLIVQLVNNSPVRKECREDAECPSGSGIASWATSFFTAIITACLALHLGTMASSQKGAIAFSSLCIGYVFKGLAYAYFDNYGEQDEDGNEIGNTFLFYLFSCVYFTLWTVSTVVIGTIFRGTWNDLRYTSQGTMLSRLCLIALIATSIAVGVACIWCAFFASSDVGDNIFDEVSEKSDDRDAIAIKFAFGSQCVWYGFFFLFFLVTAWVLRPLLVAIKYEADIIVWGLSSVWAADGVIWLQLAAIGFLIYFILEGLEKAHSSDETMEYILLIFNYVLSMTFFFLHNLIFSLSHIIFDHESEGDIDDVKDDEAGDTGEETSGDEADVGVGETTSLEQCGTEIVLSDTPEDLLDYPVVDDAEANEALPTAGPGGVKTFLRMASMRKPVTRIRSSHINLIRSASHSSYYQTNDDTFDEAMDTRVVRPRRDDDEYSDDDDSRYRK